MAKTRNYPGKDVDMLITCATIIDNAIADQAFLAAARPSWAAPFFDDLRQRIEDALKNFLGIDRATRLRLSTHALAQIQNKALFDLARLKVQINEDFKDDKPRRDEILRELGFADHLKNARSLDQEALIQLLLQFSNSLDTDLKAQIVAKGTAAETLDAIAAYADQLSQANITQETLKGIRKTATAEAVAEFNAIYDTVISIAKIAHNFHKGNSAMQSQFTYGKIHSGLNFSPKAKPPTRTST